MAIAVLLIIGLFSSIIGSLIGVGGGVLIIASALGTKCSGKINHISLLYFIYIIHSCQKAC